MRKKSAGLLSLVLAAGLGSTLGAPAVSATPAPTTQDTVANAADRPDEAAGHELPNPLEEKRRALREQAITQVLNGDATVKNARRQPGRQGQPHQVARGRQRPRQDQRRGPDRGPVRRARPREDRPDLRRARRVRQRAAPGYPDQDTDAQPSPVPTTFEGPLHNEIPEPDRSVDNTTVWQAGLRPQPLPGPLLRRGRRRRRRRRAGDGQAVLRASVLGPLQHRRHRHRLGEGALQRGPLRPQQPRPHRADQRSGTSAATPGTSSRTRVEPVVAPTRRPPARPTPQIKTSWRPSTSGTATTSTATATSTSPTATSTTSRSCTPAATRPTVTRSRARTPSGRTAGTSRPPRSAPAAPGRARWHPDRQHRHLGRRLHRRSPRTAA